MKELRYKQKLSKSFRNKAAVITVPKAIAQFWEQYWSLDLVLDNHYLIIRPAICDNL
jgi:hypothetical protein